MHEEALETLPELLAELRIRRPVLVGHSDGASIALIHAAHHPVEAVVAIAPHVFVEDVCLREIEQARTTFARASYEIDWPATTKTPTPRSSAGTTCGSILPSRSGTSAGRSGGSRARCS